MSVNITTYTDDKLSITSPSIPVYSFTIFDVGMDNYIEVLSSDWINDTYYVEKDKYTSRYRYEPDRIFTTAIFNNTFLCECISDCKMKGRSFYGTSDVRSWGYHSEFIFVLYLDRF